MIAFVDVRSTFENRSKAITSQLVQLGATVEPKLSNEVTHVIFKDGKKATRDKAKKKGLHFVSVLWIEACKRTGEHVQEASYPANVKDDSALPLAITRLKVSYYFHCINVLGREYFALLLLCLIHRHILFS